MQALLGPIYERKPIPLSCIYERDVSNLTLLGPRYEGDVRDLTLLGPSYVGNTRSISTPKILSLF